MEVVHHLRLWVPTGVLRLRDTNKNVHVSPGLPTILVNYSDIVTHERYRISFGVSSSVSPLRFLRILSSSGFDP
jgi:hypothetical protein